MSAIACKIILCGSGALNVSQLSKDLVVDLAKNPKLAKKVTDAQEEYIHTIEPLLAELTK